MTFQKAMCRPTNYHELDPREQWSIDKGLGILDWDGDITKEETEIYCKRFGLKLNKTKEVKS